MERTLKNKYYLLRHGRNIHQTELKDFLYCWPDDNPPCSLIEEGIYDAESAGERLKGKGINRIYCSDILRTRQTAGIVTEKIGFNLEKIVYDPRLRDINWGDWGGMKEEEAWKLYNNDYLKRFEVAPPRGETWSECQARIVEAFESIEKDCQNETILIVSHGDPLWLLEGHIKGMDNQALIDNKEEILIQPGGIKEI